MTRVTPRLLVRVSLLLMFGVQAAVAGADERRMAVSTDNTVFQLMKGSYGELFPEGALADGDAEVLALDAVSSDGSRLRWLVPGTGTHDAKNSEILVYDRKSNQVYLFWETVVHGIYPALYLTSFDGVQWGEILEFMGSPFARKHSLQLIVSRVSTPASGGIDGPEITLLNVFWREERSSGFDFLRWTPIVIEDGAYLGETPVYDLHSFQEAGDGLGDVAASGLVGALTAETGRNNHSTVVGYLNPATQRVATLDIELLPPILATVADKARLELIPIGRRAKSSTELADGMVSRILELTEEFHPAVLTYMAERVRALILAADEASLTAEGLPGLANRVWNEIIAVGSAIEASGLADGEDYKILEIARPGATDEPRHLLKVTLASDREAPQVEGDASLWLSDSARHVLVTWEDEERIHYRESLDEGGWSEIGSIFVGDGLDRDRIYRTLSERIRNR